MASPAGPTPSDRGATATAGRFLFVPVSGPGGAGEYFRSLAIARAVVARWPGAEVRFVLSRHAAYATQCPYPTLLIEDSPTRDVAPVIAAICSERPDAVIFDSAGRVSQLKAAARVGAVCVYVSSRPKTRWKGFKFSRMRWLDEHWIASPAFLGLDLTWLERVKLWLMPALRVRFLATFYEAPDEARRQALLARLGLVAGEFVLCCPGGAGQFAGLRSGPAEFGAAAAQIAARSGVRVVLVGASDAAGAAGIVPVASLPNADLMALAGGARLCVVNGGSLLLQCLAQHAACLAAPIAGDQASRIEGCARLGAVRAVEFSAPAIATAACALLADAPALAALRAAARELGLANGVDIAVDALDALLTRREARPVGSR